MRRWCRLLGWSGLVLGLAFAAFMGLRLRLLAPERSEEPIGGEWYLQRERTLMSSAARAGLVRYLGGERLIVSSSVGEVRYLGEDCVAYSSYAGGVGRQVFAVCGSGSPVWLAAGPPDQWVLGVDCLEEFQWVNGERAPKRRLAFEQIRLLARLKQDR